MDLKLVKIDNKTNQITYKCISVDTSALFVINMNKYKLVSINDINMNENDIEFIADSLRLIRNEITKFKAI